MVRPRADRRQDAGARLRPGDRLATREVTDDGDTPCASSYAIDQTITGEQPEFPHDYQARLTVEFASDHLQISLWASNTGDEPFTIEEALHTYLAVSDVREVTIDGLDGVTYLDKNLPEPAFDQVQQRCSRSAADRPHRPGVRARRSGDRRRPGLRTPAAC